MERKKWLLIVLAMGDSLSPVQLQKSLFLISKEIPDIKQDDFYQFNPYDYGPFDAAIYSDALALATEELAIIENPIERGWRRYRITDTGREEAEKLMSTLPKPKLDQTRDIVALVKSLSFSGLVRKIYEKYPVYRVNSVFQSEG